MDKEYFIGIDEICVHHSIEQSFLVALKDHGLIDIEESGFIALNQLQNIEKYIHLHYELDINLEGLETIHYMLEKMAELRNEIAVLRNRLRLYESQE